jgi:myo-inositol 2-dehydrogenase/D-chiro-inositol 1-dehydrogenase
VVAAEAKAGKRLVQIGYMRRFDPAYVEMKATWQSGALGKPLMFHCVHRNVSAPPWFDSKMAIANSAVHEFDIARWVLDADLTSAHVFRPSAASPDAIVTPVFLVLTSATGQLVNIEIFNNATYGYDVRGELVCEKGTVSLRSPVHSETSVSLTQAIRYPADWRPRFADAYRLQNQAWIRAIASDDPVGASAWDGYAASLVAEAGVQSLLEGRSVTIVMAKKPALYP